MQKFNSHKILPVFLLCNLLCGAYSGDSAEKTGYTKNKGNIIIKFDGIKNPIGMIGILLFEDKDGFPENASKAARSVLIPADEAEDGAVFESVTYGNYAISLIHDENMNNKLDKNWLGRPLEGYGVSNNKYRIFGAPSYNDALFGLAEPEIEINIEINY